MENKPFVGFASIDINDGRGRKFRIAKIASTFTAEALAIGETLEIIEKIGSEQNFMIFSDSARVLQGSDSQLLWQILKPSGKRKAFTVSLKTLNGIEDKATLKGATGMGRHRGSAK
jgi:hypothetical protein